VLDAKLDHRSCDIVNSMLAPTPSSPCLGCSGTSSSHPPLLVPRSSIPSGSRRNVLNALAHVANVRTQHGTLPSRAIGHKGLRQLHSTRLPPCQASIDDPDMAPLVKKMEEEVCFLERILGAGSWSRRIRGLHYIVHTSLMPGCSSV